MNINEIRNVKELLSFSKENPVEYFFFWAGEFSQWHKSPFILDQVEYENAEQYMMAKKAKLFNDQKTFSLIMETSDPRTAKKLGREVKNYDDALWSEHRFDVVVAGNMAKFSQNPKLLDLIKSTQDKVLVEASPYDRIWGIGLPVYHINAGVPEKWNGINLLGFALMEVRSKLT